MNYNNIIVSLVLLISTTSIGNAQSMIYKTADSIKVMQLLDKAPADKSGNEYMFYFGSQLKDVPYVAKTLEQNAKENLVINLRELDCTTLIENAMALSLCMKNNKKTFLDFANYLRQIRYENGYIAYETRLHYFTSWIDNAVKAGFAKEEKQEELPHSLYTKTQVLNIDYMSQHISAYPVLVCDSTLIPKIRKTEQELTGRKYKYIPKALLKNYTAMKKHIHTGDIIVIITKKKGLDTSHIGIASWHADGTLHLLNASQIHKKVVDEQMSLHTYMMKHPTQIGIRVIHPM